MKFRSLRQKLIFRNSITLSLSIVIVLLIFISFSIQASNRQLEKIRQNHQKALDEKGRALVVDKAITLKEYVEDNAIAGITKVIEATLKDDDSVEYGAFVLAKEYKAWAWFNPGEGNIASDSQVMKNEVTEWACSLKSFGQKIIPWDGKEIRWFASPIYGQPPLDDEAFDDDAYDEENRPEIVIGAMIYGLSSKTMEIDAAEESYEHAKYLKRNLVAAFFLVLGTLGLGFFMTQRQAGTITRPLAVLTSAADTIASGNYSIEVEVSSGDEIEALAISFNQMVKDLDTTYADLHTKNKELEEARNELEDLNKHLEEKVRDRTKRLAESESKFRTLFEESADGILIATEQEILDCNPTMLSMIGCSTKEELLSLSPYELSPEIQPDNSDSAEKLHEYINAVISEGSQCFEWVNSRIDGDTFHSEIVITSLPLNGQQVLHMVFRDITERKETEDALKDAQLKLVETAHSAGMAEIATGVLHNIGNILNSVNISTEEIGLTLKNSKIKGFIKANEMVRKHMDHLGEFFVEHPKGKLIPGYYINLGEAIADEHHIMDEEIKALTNKVSMMRDVISTQQNYAKASLYTEDVVITDIVEDAIKLQIASLNKQGVVIERNYVDQPTGMVPKVKLVHVLTNLIKNGKEAMSDNDMLNKAQRLHITIEQSDDQNTEIRIADNGCGIETENLDKIFNHGFTTKENGHGFGLHTCANFMTEMGGSLSAESDGKDGSVFIVRFPLICKDKPHDEAEA